MTSKGKLHIAIPVELLADLDHSRGDVSRSLFVQRAIERTLTAMHGGLRRRKR